MKTTVFAGVAALVAALTIPPAVAADLVAVAVVPSQTTTATNPELALTQMPLSRATVKAEARDAERRGLIPRGEAHLLLPDYAPRSTLSRAQVKAETRLAVAAGLIPRGEEQLPFATATPSTLSRATVKGEARTAEQLRQIPRGEASFPAN